MKIPLLGKCLLLVGLLSLTGCGFHLRGGNGGRLPPQFHRIYLETPSPYSPLTKQLQQILAQVGVTLTPRPEKASLTLTLLSENLQQQQTNTNSTTQLTTYDLSYTLRYQVSNGKGVIIIPTKTITTTRGYTLSTNQVLSASYHQLFLEQDLRYEAIHQLLNQLNSKNTLQAILDI